MSPNQEQSSPKRVWYASYGSNLQRERLMCYIKGGTPKETYPKMSNDDIVEYLLRADGLGGKIAGNSSG